MGDRLMIRKLIQRMALLMAIEMSLAILLAYWGGLAFGRYIGENIYISALWCVVSTVLVLQILLNESFETAWLRIVGSFIGSLISCAAVILLGYHIGTLLLAVFLTIIVVALLKIKETLRLATLTATVIIIIGIANPNTPVWLNSLSRFIESVIGTIIAISFTALFLPLRRRYNLLNK